MFSVKKTTKPGNKLTDWLQINQLVSEQYLCHILMTEGCLHCWWSGLCMQLQTRKHPLTLRTASSRPARKGGIANTRFQKPTAMPLRHLLPPLLLWLGVIHIGATVSVHSSVCASANILPNPWQTHLNVLHAPLPVWVCWVDRHHCHQATLNSVWRSALIMSANLVWLQLTVLLPWWWEVAVG